MNLTWHDWLASILWRSTRDVKSCFVMDVLAMFAVGPAVGDVSFSWT